MPISDKEKAREYKRLWMANKRKQQKKCVEPVEPQPKKVEPKPVEPIVEPKPNNVEPEKAVEPSLIVEPKNVEPCPRNHHSLTDLFHQATTKIKQDYQAIYKDPEVSRKCFDCHNRERNYQILLSLLEKYWAKNKRLPKGGMSM